MMTFDAALIFVLNLQRHRELSCGALAISGSVAICM